MTRQAEAQLLDFLMSEENLPYVVEILQQSRQIRKRLFRQFWAELHLYLQKNMPTLPASLASMEWWPLAEGKMDDKRAWLWYWDSRLKDETRYLYYGAYCERAGDTRCLGVGPLWEGGAPDRKVYELKSVAKLGEHLTSGGFKTGRTYLRYREISQFASAEDLLATIITSEKESLLRQISDGFWSLVGDTLGMVAEANEEIVKAGPPIEFLCTTAPLESP
ncbi:MAG: hypothetical protein ABSG86_20115 [Thermoguttaceae bacterium]|jgi:hypothetical protein